MRSRRAAAKGSVILRRGVYYWRQRLHGKDLPLERLGSTNELKSKHAAKAERDRRWLQRTVVVSGHASVITVAALVHEFVAVRVNATMKDSGARSVRSRLHKHVIPRLGELTLMQVDALQVQRFIAALVAEQLSRSSIEAVLAALSCLLEFGREAGYASPELRRRALRLPPKALSSAKRYFTTDEQVRIITVAPWPWKAAFGIAAMLCLRCGEVLGMRWCDVDFALQVIRVRQNAVNGRLQTVKSKNSEVDLPLPEPLAVLLRQYEQWVDALLAAEHSEKLSTSLLFSDACGLPFTGNRIRAELAAVLKQLGIKHGGMHAFRHGSVTRIADHASPHVLRSIARHGRIETTLGIYTHTEADSMRDAVNRGAAPFKQGNNGGTEVAFSPANNG